MTGTVLVVQEMAFSYPGRHVFAGFSAAFAPGMTWVRGSNGSGKSTLLKLLAGALPPLAGRLSVAGFDAATQPLAFRREVFWCGPGAIAFDHLRPPEYFAFLRGLYPRFVDAALAGHLQALGLTPFLGKPLAALSTGTQRKVWLAAALCAGTAAVLLDEPLNALDAASLQHVLAQLEGAAEDTRRAWIVASHEAPGRAALHAARLELEEAALR
jgi:ABC-type multidrug transport system ATPase subunit